MDSSANITSVAEIGHFRVALKSFEQDAAGALTLVMMQIRRMVDWVEHDQLQHWQMRVKRGFDEVSETRTTLERCRMFALEGERRSCEEEKKAFEKAKRSLRHAQEKVEVVKKWARTLSHETAEYQASAGALGGWLESECPKALASLERMIASLEAYLATEVVGTPEPASAVTSEPIARPVEPPERETGPTEDGPGDGQPQQEETPCE